MPRSSLLRALNLVRFLHIPCDLTPNSTLLPISDEGNADQDRLQNHHAFIDIRVFYDVDHLLDKVVSR
ncbi:hypothetical protein VTN96DRAFT_6951 [Rasamsonia emersonii]